MFKKLKVRTGLYGLIMGAVFCIGGVVASIGILSSLDNGQKEEQAHISEMRLNLGLLDSVLLHARRAEKDFLLRRLDKYIDKHAAIMARAHDLLNLVESQGRILGMSKDLEGVAVADALMTKYQETFAELVKLNRAVGLTPSEGFEGELRKTVHELEGQIKELGNSDLMAAMLMMRRHEKDFLLRNATKYVDRMANSVVAFQDFPTEMFGSEQDAKTAKSLVIKYGEAFKELVKTKFEELEARKRLSATYAEFSPLYEELTSALATGMAGRTAAADKVKSNYFIGIVTASGIGLAIYIICAMQLSKALTRPLVTYSKALRSLADGDVQAPEENSRFFELQLLSGAYTKLATKEEERAVLEEKITLSHSDQAFVVDQMGSGLRRLSEGDLTYSIDQPFAEDYEALRENFNETVQTLVDIIETVVMNSEKIRDSSEEISQSSSDLSQRTESQAATLEQTAAALEQLTTSVKSAAAGAKEVEGIVASASATAEKSGTVVREAVDAMSLIEKSSVQISQIISVIDDISFQTNLLALNAGVEAARAGEAGRGFAVVASEVRALAQRSSDAAQEIKQLISDSAPWRGIGGSDR